MAVVASRFLQAARNASLACRTAATASRSARAAPKTATCTTSSAHVAAEAATCAASSARSAAEAATSAASSARAAAEAATCAARSAHAAAEAATSAARLGSGIKAPPENSPTLADASTEPHDSAPTPHISSDDYEGLPEDAKVPTDKDLESDEATWAFYERWCKAAHKERESRDHVEMARRFHARFVHKWNSHVPPDPKEAARYLKKRESARLLISKGKDVTHIDECYLPIELGQCAVGGDPFITEYLVEENRGG